MARLMVVEAAAGDVAVRKVRAEASGMMTRSNSEPLRQLQRHHDDPRFRQAVALAEHGDAVQRLCEAFGVVLPGDDHRR